MTLQALFARGFALGAFIFVSPGFAANADIVPSVARISDPVSVSRTCPTGDNKCLALTGYAAYEITITNNTTNAINQVVVNGTAAVVADSSGRAAATTFKESIGAVCTQTGKTADQTSVACNVGQVKGSSSFVVIFESPTVGSKIAFSIAGTFSNAASPETPTAENGTFSSGPVDINLTETATAEQQKTFKTIVPSSGGKFVTGTGVPSDVDTFVTRLSVPSQTGQSGREYSIATAEEKNPIEELCPTSAPCGGSVNISLKKKDESKATFYPPNPVNVLGDFLVIELWRSDFKGNIKNANIYYKDPEQTNPAYVPVFECAPYPTDNSVARCIYDRKVFSNKDDEVKSGQVPAGAARIRILAGENGFYAW